MSWRMAATPTAERWRAGEDREFIISLSHVERKGRRERRKERRGEKKSVPPPPPPPLHFEK